MDSIQIELEKAFRQQTTPVAIEVMEKQPSFSVESQTIMTGQVEVESEKKNTSIPRPEVDQTRVRDIGQKVVNFGSRLDSLEDEVDEIQMKCGTISTRILEKVNLDYVAKIKVRRFTIKSKRLSFVTGRHLPGIIQNSCQHHLHELQSSGEFERRISRGVCFFNC